MIDKHPLRKFVNQMQSSIMIMLHKLHMHRFPRHDESVQAFLEVLAYMTIPRAMLKGFDDIENACHVVAHAQVGAMGAQMVAQKEAVRPSDNHQFGDSFPHSRMNRWTKHVHLSFPGKLRVRRRCLQTSGVCAPNP